jgi:putative DNA primase/helicase
LKRDAGSSYPVESRPAAGLHTTELPTWALSKRYAPLAPCWVCWRWVWNPKKYGGKGGWDKLPPGARAGKEAKSNTSSTWTTFEVALQAYESGSFDGIGIVLGAIPGSERTLAGLDLDEVRQPQSGIIQPWALYYLYLLNTYTEISPSGEGVKALAWGKLPKGRRENEECGIEMYDSGRYFTVTGHRLDELPADTEERSEALLQTHAPAFPPPRVCPQRPQTSACGYKNAICCPVATG